MCIMCSIGLTGFVTKYIIDCPHFTFVLKLSPQEFPLAINGVCSLSITAWEIEHTPHIVYIILPTGTLLVSYQTVLLIQLCTIEYVSNYNYNVRQQRNYTYAQIVLHTSSNILIIIMSSTQ